MPAALIGGIVAGAGAIGAAAISSSAQRRAANDVAQVTRDTTSQNNALAREIYDKNSAALSPYQGMGTQANNALSGLIYGTDGKSQTDILRETPGYQFRFDEGMRALNSGWAGRGMLNSGAAQKAALRYGQDYASNEYSNRYNMLAAQQGVGLSAASAQAGVGTNYAGQVTSNNNALASALGNSTLLRGNATANTWSTAAGALGNISGALISSYAPRGRGVFS